MIGDFEIQQQVLHNPFDIAIHKEVFYNYLEVVILADGTIEYAVPSHQEKLISICKDKLDVTRAELMDRCPREYWFDMLSWFSDISGAIAVWNDGYIGVPNKKQLESIQLLIDNGLFKYK